MKRYKHIEEKVTCDICKKDMINEKLKDYIIYDVKGSQNASLNIRLIGHGLSEVLDICEHCKARAMFFNLMRYWHIAKKLYDHYEKKEDLTRLTQMGKFLKDFYDKDWQETGTNWIRAEDIKSKKMKRRDKN